MTEGEKHLMTVTWTHREAMAIISSWGCFIQLTVEGPEAKHEIFRSDYLPKCKAIMKNLTLEEVLEISKKMLKLLDAVDQGTGEDMIRP